MTNSRIRATQWPWRDYHKQLLKQKKVNKCPYFIKQWQNCPSRYVCINTHMGCYTDSLAYWATWKHNHRSKLVNYLHIEVQIHNNNFDMTHWGRGMECAQPERPAQDQTPKNELLSTGAPQWERACFWGGEGKRWMGAGGWAAMAGVMGKGTG